MRLPDKIEIPVYRLKTEWYRIGKSRRRLFLHILVLFTVGLVFALISMANPFANLQWSLSDRLYLTEELPSDTDVVIAAIDENTLDQAYSEGYESLTEWPRYIHEEAIRNLSNAGAVVIGFDVLFRSIDEYDDDLAEAMKNADNVVQPVLGIQGQGVNVFEGFLKPNSTLYDASHSLGHANVFPDADGKVRRLPLIVEGTDGEKFPSLSLAMLDAVYSIYSITDGEIKYTDYDYEVSNGEIYLPPSNYVFKEEGVGNIESNFKRSIPIDSSTCMRVNYVNEPGTFIDRGISYWDAYKNTFDPAKINGKIVLVGITESGWAAEIGGDYWVTPVSSEKMFGVEIHATAIDTILRGRFISESGETSALLIVLLLVGITGLSLPRLNLRWGGILTLGLLIAYVTIAAFLFYSKGYTMNLVYPPIVLPLVYVTSLVYRITIEQADKRQVKDLFGKYVSAEVAGEIMRLSDSEDLKLGGEERIVTVLFCDIRGFTQLSERISPDAIVNILNKYFSVIIDRILANEGMINKFAGDNIMAVWNAPQYQPDHALLAVRAAVESQKGIREMHEQDAYSTQVQFGFGISTGEAIAGNVGSAGRMEYTVIGDAVNLASRICGAATGGEVWISEQTMEQVRDEFNLKELPPQQFKGKSEAVIVYEVEQ